jgi:hypothetical protein
LGLAEVSLFVNLGRILPQRRRALVTSQLLPGFLNLSSTSKISGASLLQALIL